MASLKELELTVVWELCWNRWSEALVLLHVGPFIWLFGPPHSMACGFQEEAIQEKDRLKRRISFIFNRKIICTYREEKINCDTSRV